MKNKNNDTTINDDISWVHKKYTQDMWLFTQSTYTEEWLFERHDSCSYAY